jgi:integrase
VLTSKKVARLKTPGRYRDGLIPGLYLQITETGGRSWVMRYELNERERMLGLGSVKTFTLKEARERARSARQLLADGKDPLETKRADKAAARLAEARKLRFDEAADQYFKQHLASWRSTVHAKQFINSLRINAFPILGNIDVASIDTPDVLRVIEPIWYRKAKTADRVRNRIERIIDWAIARGHRPPGTNPARWRGHLDQILPATSKIATKENFAALKYAELPAFMAKLRRYPSIAARALEFCILTAARSGEVYGAVWDEIDLKSATWIIPPQRTKTGREHRVPLSPQALKLLQALPRESGNQYVFTGPKTGSRLAHPAMFLMLERVGHSNITIHGFRSTFSDWCHERTSFASHIIELSLAHSVGSAVERAYRRTDLLAQRQQLLAKWGKYCCSPPAVSSETVTPIRSAR